MIMTIWVRQEEDRDEDCFLACYFKAHVEENKISSCAGNKM